MYINKEYILSSGSGRLVLIKDNNSVVKIALNKFGKMQNDNEVLIYEKYRKDSEIGKYLPESKMVGDNDIIEQERLYFSEINEHEFFKYKKAMEKIAPTHNEIELTTKRHVAVNKYGMLKCVDTGVTKDSLPLKEWLKTKSTILRKDNKPLTKLRKFSELLNCREMMENYNISTDEAFILFDYLEDYSRYKIQNSTKYRNIKLTKEDLDALLIKYIF